MWMQSSSSSAHSSCALTVLTKWLSDTNYITNTKTYNEPFRGVLEKDMISMTITPIVKSPHRPHTG